MNNNLLPKLIVIIGLAAFFLLGGKIIAGTYLSLGKCGLSTTAPCYREISQPTGQKQVMVDNLDPNKSYEFVIKDQAGKVVESGRVTKEQFQQFTSKNDMTGVTCADSDEGNKPDLRGTLSLSTGFQISDQCSGDQVLENYCLDGKQARALHPCELGCENGACVRVAANSTACTDTDGGANYNIQGKLNWATQDYDTFDSCKNDRQLIEYFCTPMGDSFGYKEKIYDCPGACLNGACLSI